MAETQPKITKTHKRVKTPTVLQMEAVECGAASLAMVLAHYGRFVPLEILRVECGVSRDGSKASNVLRAARKYGLDAKGFRQEPDELRDMPVPMIVHWNFNHFLVLEGFKKGKAYLNDPALGPRVVDASEFDQSFTGVAMTLQKGPDFEPGGEKYDLMGALWKRIHDSVPALTFVVIAGLALVIPGLVIPTFGRIFIDDILVGGMHEWLRPLLLGMGLTLLLRMGLSWLQWHYLLRLGTRLALSSSSKFLWHLFHLPIDFFHQRQAGDLSARVASNDRVANLLSGELAKAILNVIQVVFFAFLMWKYDHVLTLIGVVIALLNLTALKYVARKRKDESQKMLVDSGKLAAASVGGIYLIETLKATGSESDFFEQWSGMYTKVLNSQQRLAAPTIFLNAVTPMLMQFSTVAILGIGGLRVMDGHLTMGMLVAFQSLMASFMIPVNELVELGGTLQEVEGDMKRLDDVHRYPQDSQFDVQVQPSPLNDEGEDSGSDGDSEKLTGRVEFRNVTFGYSKLAPALIEDFNLVIEPGQRVALVGGSGSGKSTLAKLVSGLYEPWEGQILFDGKTRKEIPRTKINNSLSVVDQDIFIFKGTITENFTMWDHTVAHESILTAGRDACIHDDIVSRAGGYGGVMEEGGINFSGGQRQRMEIARSLVNNATIMVLDEATSALDPKTEQIIDGNLRRRGCTCIIVAHRLSTIRDCDEIILLEQGKVVQRGKHDEMIDVDGPYQRLIQAE